MKYQKVYDSMPIIIQNIMATLYGYMVKKERYGKVYYQHLAFLQLFNGWAREEQVSFQVKELQRLLKYSISNSLFYKKLYEGINIFDLENIEELEKLPMVTKEMIRNSIDDVITLSKSKAIISKTGGTSGKSLSIYRSIEDEQKRKATLDYFKRMHGFTNGKMRRATFNGKHIIPPSQSKKIFWRYNSASRQKIYSTFHVTEENIPYYIENLNRFKPHSIDGFISSIYEIASYAMRNKIRFSFQPVAIFPTSETVLASQRKLIEKMFHCKVRDQYASSEGAPFVWECTKGNLHYDISTGVIEQLGESNEVLVTSFTTYGTPLVRYRIGDKMIFDSEKAKCNCGINTPLVKSIEGRSIDFLYSTVGAKIYLGNISNIFKDVPNSIIKAQLIQNDLKSLEIKIKVDSNFDEAHLKILEDAVYHKLGSDINVKFTIVDHIPNEKNGKYRYIINNVDIVKNI
jgi:phenylacetate-CoA ligase